MSRAGLRMRLVEIDGRPGKNKSRIGIFDQVVNAVVKNRHADTAIKIAADQSRRTFGIGRKKNPGKFVLDIPWHMGRDDVESSSPLVSDLGPEEMDLGLFIFIEKVHLFVNLDVRLPGDNHIAVLQRPIAVGFLSVDDDSLLGKLGFDHVEQTGRNFLETNDVESRHRSKVE